MRIRSVTWGLKAITADVLITNVSGHIVRTAFHESTGSAAAHFELWDGVSTGGQLLDPFSLLSSESARDQYADEIYPFNVGLFMHVISGSIDASITFMPTRDPDKWARPVYVVEAVVVREVDGAWQMSPARGGGL